MKKTLVLIMSIVICAGSVIPAYASVTPSGVSATLADNTLEFDEIDDLIHVYNATVKENSYNLTKYKQPDEGVEDKETTRLGYQATEMSLCQQAKELMIGYYDAQLNAESAALNVQLLTSQLQLTQAKANIGSATQIDVLTATENLLNAQKTQTDADAAVGTTKKDLQVMCGWKYESDADVATLSEPDFARIDTLDPAGDAQKAIDNNFTLKANERRKKNADDDSDKNQYEATIKSNKETITSSINVAYANVIAARDAYNAAVTTAQVQEKNLQTVTVKRSTGAASQMELQTQTINTRLAQIALEQAKHNVLKMLVEYDYAVAGIANA